MPIIIKNLTTEQLSVDLNLVGKPAIRETLAIGGQKNIGDRVTIDELNLNATFRQLVSSGRMSVTSSSDPTAPVLVPGVVDDQQLSYVQAVAATETILLGTASLAGQLSGTVSIGVATSDDETMTIDLLVNGVSVLSSAVLFDTPSSAQTPVNFDVSTPNVQPGDEISVEFTYNAGSSPTPVVNTAVNVAIT